MNDFIKASQSNKKEIENELEEHIALVLKQAEKLYVDGQGQSATEVYRAILEIQPNNPQANYKLGVSSFELKQYHEALPFFRVAIEASPKTPIFWYAYIEALLLAEQNSHADRALNLAEKYCTPTGELNELRKRLADIRPKPTSSIARAHRIASQNHSQLILNDSILQLLGVVLTENIDEINTALNKNNINKALSIKPKKKSDKNNEKISFRKNISPNLNLTAFEKTIGKLNAGNRHNEILELIFKSILGIKLHAELIGTKIFTPYFDNILENIDLDIRKITPRNAKMANIVIASEIYDFGGHTKVINEILESVDNPILIITDIFNRFAQLNFFEKISSTLVKCPVFLLPNESYLDKSIRLSKFINGYAKNVFLVSHHEDVVAVAGCQKKIDSHFYFIHHADHNPALGNTVKHFQHVDLFMDMKELCAEDLKKEVILLPTTASDCGVKTNNYPIEIFSTVTAGSFGKFMILGELSLPNIIVTALRTCRGKHYHFGNIPTECLEMINRQLIDAGLKPESFLCMGNVPSLWRSLLEIDAHIFIGSAPTRGGKSEIEAQGASYPLLIYKDIDSPKYLNVASCNVSTIYWSAISDLKAGLEAIMVNHAARSAESRKFYLENNAKEKFTKVISELSR